MKFNTTDFTRKCQFPLLLALGGMPLFSLILVHNAPEALGSLLLFLPLFVALAWLCMVIPGRLRLACCALGCAAFILLGLRLLPVQGEFAVVSSRSVSLGEGVFAFSVPLMHCALLVYSLRFAAWNRETELSFNTCAAGVVLYALTQFVAFMYRNLDSSPFDPLQPWLGACFIAYLLLMLLSLNRLSLHGAAQGRQRAPQTMRRQNEVFTIVFLILVVLTAAAPALAAAIKRFWFALAAGIGKIIHALVSLFPSESVHSSGGGAGGETMLGDMDFAEPSLLAKVLEVIAIGFAYVLLAVLLVWITVRVVRKLSALAHLFLHRIQGYFSSVSEDYEDEIIDTREEGEKSGSLWGRLRANLSFMSEKQLSPGERIRLRYRRLLIRHPGWHKSQTARENLQSPAASLYEKARYSGQSISSEEAERFAEQIKHL